MGAESYQGRVVGPKRRDAPDSPGDESTGPRAGHPPSLVGPPPGSPLGTQTSVVSDVWTPVSTPRVVGTPVPWTRTMVELASLDTLESSKELGTLRP